MQRHPILPLQRVFGACRSCNPVALQQSRFKDNTLASGSAATQRGLIYSTVLLDWDRKLVFVCEEVQLCWASPMPGRGNPAEQTPPALKCHSQAEKKHLHFFFHFAKPKYMTYGFGIGMKATFQQLSNMSVHDRDVLNRPCKAYFRISSCGNMALNPTDVERAPWSQSLRFGMY